MSNPILNGKWRFHYDHNGAGVWVVELLDGPATHGQLVSVTRNDWQVSLMALSMARTASELGQRLNAALAPYAEVE